MADSSRTIMTDAGFALETRVRADETKMQFTRATISTDDHFSDTDDALAKLTELSNIQQDGKVTAVQVINTTTVYVQVDVNQAESKADYQMRSAALYAKDDDGTEVLYGVTVLQDPVFVHKDADGSYLGFGINTTVGRASNVVVVVDPANMVTQQVFESTMKNYYTKAEVDAKFVTDDDFASKLPKNIATTDAANTFAKSQTLAGGATDGKGNAYATTKDVATDLNNGLSTKVTDNKNGTISVNGTSILPANEYVIDRIDTSYTDMNDVLMGWHYLNGWADVSKLANWGLLQDLYYIHCFKSGYGVSTNIQIAYGVELNNTYMRTAFGTNWTTWKLTADDSKVVHTADMRKPANDVAGIEEVNAKQDKLDYTPANAANVVDRNPDTGVVSKPTDFTNLTVNGGKSVATRDDLKSLEASAWRELNFDVSQENYKAFSAAKIVYKINRDEKYISFFFVGTPSHVGNVANNSTLVTDTISLVMDLSSVLTEISGINFETEYGQISDNNSHAASLGYAGAKVVFTSQVFIPNDLVGVTFLPKDYPDCRIYYTSLVNGI